MNNANSETSPISIDALESQVRMVGDLLGEVLCELSGKTVYDAVEHLRTGYIQLSQQDDQQKRKRFFLRARRVLRRVGRRPF